MPFRHVTLPRGSDGGNLAFYTFRTGETNASWFFCSLLFTGLLNTGSPDTYYLYP